MAGIWANMRWQRAVLRDARLRATTRVVGAAFAHRLDRDDLTGALGGAEGLQRETALSETTVYRALDQLVEAQWLVRIYRGTYGRPSKFRGRYPSNRPVTVTVEVEAPFVCARCGTVGAVRQPGRPVCVDCP